MTDTNLLEEATEQDIEARAADGKPENLPEKFWNPETQTVRLDALVRSYAELERKMSQIPAPPNSPEEYCVNCEHGLFEPDQEINTRLHENGFTPEQVQVVYDLAAEKLVPMILDIAGDFQADREVERLIEHFGGPGQWREVSRQLLAFGKKNLPADVLEGLSGSFEGVMALHRMMKAQEPGLQKQAASAEGSSEQDLHSMMRDPRYWKNKDPAFVSKVSEGFKNLYGNR